MSAPQDDPVADLREVESYFDDRADADDGRPNDAMRNLTYVRAAINEIGRLRRKLTEIHEISQEHLVPSWQVIENIAATARSALEKNG